MMRLRTEWQAEQQPLDQEFARRERKPYLTARAGDLSLRAWRGSWERVDYDEEGSISFSVRSIDFLIEDRTHPIAGGRLKVWRCTDGCGFVDEFRLCADEYSKADYDASEVVYAAWPHGLVADSPFTHGDLVIFDRLRIEVTSAVLSRAAWSLIAKVIDPFRNKKSRTRGSVLLLKAFPLEFEGSSPASRSSTDATPWCGYISGGSACRLCLPRTAVRDGFGRGSHIRPIRLQAPTGAIRGVILSR